MHVYKAINAVQAELARTGITKDRTNTFDSYQFRGIDDVYNALSPLLAKHGLCILPRILTREVVERASQKGGALFYVTVEAEFDFIAAQDGSRHTVRTFGEAMDRGDKATNKAMSAAYKYAAFQSFAIPTEGDNDADAQTHAVAAANPRIDKSAIIPATVGAGDDLTAERRNELDNVALDIIDMAAAGRETDAIRTYYAIADNDEKIYVWKCLAAESKLRAVIKANSPHKAAT